MARLSSGLSCLTGLSRHAGLSDCTAELDQVQRVALGAIDDECHRLVGGRRPQERMRQLATRASVERLQRDSRVDRPGRRRRPTRTVHEQPAQGRIRQIADGFFDDRCARRVQPVAVVHRHDEAALLSGSSQKRLGRPGQQALTQLGWQRRRPLVEWLSRPGEQVAYYCRRQANIQAFDI